MKNYAANADGFVDGVYRKKDEVFPMSDRQAKYLAPPYGTSVRREAEVAKAQPVDVSSRRKRGGDVEEASE